MRDWTDLNCEIADCWKVFWNVDPAPLMVPLSEELLVDGDDEHADRAVTTARIVTPPAPIVTRFLPPACMVGISFSDFSAAITPVNEQP
jgi:hypothetical protein